MFEQDKFVEHLLKVRERGPFSDATRIDHALHEVQNRMSQHLGTEYPLEELHTKFQQLKHEFNVFTGILATPGVELHEEFDWVFVPHMQKDNLLRMYPDAKRFFIEPPEHWQQMKALFSSHGLVYADGKESTEKGNIAGQTPENPIVLSENSCDGLVGNSTRNRRFEINKGNNVSDNYGKAKKVSLASSIPWAGSRLPTCESRNGPHNLVGAANDEVIVQPHHRRQYRHLIDEPSEESTAASNQPWAGMG